MSAPAALGHQKKQSDYEDVALVMSVVSVVNIAELTSFYLIPKNISREINFLCVILTEFFFNFWQTRILLI